MGRQIETCRDDVEQELIRLGVRPSHYTLTSHRLRLLGGGRVHEFDLRLGVLRGVEARDQILADVRLAALGGGDA